MFSIPLPISALDYESFPDETGFTIPEKIALRNAWTIIGPDKAYHAHELVLNFFSDYEELLETFRVKGAFKLRALHTHPLKVFTTLEAMIFNGLDGVVQMHGILSPIAEYHSKRNVGSTEVALMTDTLGKHLKKYLQRMLSPTLERSIDKICQVIVNVHQMH